MLPAPTSYPVCLNLRGKKIVVVGAGKVAHRKVESLLPSGAEITVIAPSQCDAIVALSVSGRIRLEPRRYGKGDLQDAFLVVVATDDETVNAEVSERAQGDGTLVNVVDRPELCSFTLPAVARRGNLLFTVSTGGRCPSLSRMLREEVEKVFGPEYGVLLEWMGGLRARMLALGWETGRVNGALTGLYGAGLLPAILRDRAGLQRMLEDHLGPEFASFPGPEGTSAGEEPG